MPSTPEGFANRIDRLTADLVGQGRRVQSLVEAAFDSVFERSPAAASRVIALDDEIDRADVDIEIAAVQLLTDAARQGAALGEGDLRRVLTIAKVNNELERIADAAVAIAERVPDLAAHAAPVPDTFRVMANSCVGVVRDVDAAFDRRDAGLARLVLQSEDAIAAFKEAILRDAERQIASGAVSVDFAFLLHEFAHHCQTIADHVTNIAEQVIYAATGRIVRHMQGKWRDVPSA